MSVQSRQPKLGDRVRFDFENLKAEGVIIHVGATSSRATVAITRKLDESGLEGWTLSAKRPLPPRFRGLKATRGWHVPWDRLEYLGELRVVPETEPWLE